jgi:hypothetical protein
VEDEASASRASPVLTFFGIGSELAARFIADSSGIHRCALWWCVTPSGRGRFDRALCIFYFFSDGLAPVIRAGFSAGTSESSSTLRPPPFYLLLVSVECLESVKDAFEAKVFCLDALRLHLVAPLPCGEPFVQEFVKAILGTSTFLFFH